MNPKIEIITAFSPSFGEIFQMTYSANLKSRYGIAAYQTCDNNVQGWKVPERYKGFGRSHPNEEKFDRKERICGVAPWKPSLMAHVLSQEVDQEKVFIWLDADAWVIRPLDDLLSMPFDIALTMRRPAERGRSDWPEVYGYLNTGFVAMRATPETMYFLKLWQIEIDNTASKSDQHAANNLVRKATSLGDNCYDMNFGFEELGEYESRCNIRILRTDEYNNYYAPEEPGPTTKVLHFKKDVRQKNDMKAWIEKTTGGKL